MVRHGPTSSADYATHLVMEQTTKCTKWPCQSVRRARRRCHPPTRLQLSFPKRLVHFGLLFLLLSGTNGQFGEIASVISSLVANGAPAGLAGLGTAGSLGSLGASAGTGAASALSNIGPLYQLAQAALQLTGTGVGIANQASESAWFPVVVENAAKMNRDFQDRLVQGGLGGGGLGGAAVGPTKGGIKDRSVNKNGGEFGTEYGKEFGSEEKGSSGSGGNIGSVDTSSARIFGSRVSLLPLLPGFGTTLATLLPEGTRRPNLPALGSLLPGESPLGEFSTAERKMIGIGSVEEVPLSPQATESGQNGAVGIASPLGASLPPPAATDGLLVPSEIMSTKGRRPLASTAKPTSTSTIGKGNNPSAISSPKITVQLPDYEGEKEGDMKSREMEETEQTQKQNTKHNKDNMMEKIETEFNMDNDGLPAGRQGTETAVMEEGKLEPLIPSAEHSVQRVQRLNMTHIETGNSEEEEDEKNNGDIAAYTVPKLQKLISQLKSGNLSELDLEELQNQLNANDGGEPRENTEPTTTPSAEDETATANGKENARGKSDGTFSGKGSKRIQLPNPKRENASNRNLEAFRKGSERSEEEQGTEHKNPIGVDSLELVDGQRDPILRKIIDFKHPPVILSLERPRHAAASPPRTEEEEEGITPFLPHSNERSEKRRSNRIDGGEGTKTKMTANATEQPQQQQQQRQQQRQRSAEAAALPSRALGARSEKKFNLRRPQQQKRRPMTSLTKHETGQNEHQNDADEYIDQEDADQHETDQHGDDQQQLLVVDSMVDKPTTDQQQLQRQSLPQPHAIPSLPSDQSPNWSPNSEQQQQQWTQNNGWVQQQQQQQEVAFEQLQKQQIGWGQSEQQQQIHPHYPQQPNQLQYTQQPNQLQYTQQPNQLQYTQQPNQLQYTQQPNQLQYTQQPNQLQYTQQPNQLQYTQLQYTQQPNQLQYPQQPNHLQYLQQPNQLQYPQQSDQLQYQSQYLRPPNQSQSPQQTNPLSYPSLQSKQLQYPEQQFPQQQRQLPTFHLHNHQPKSLQQNKQNMGDVTTSNGRRLQFGQRQRAVEKPIGKQSDKRPNEQRAGERKVPKDIPSRAVPKDIPSRAVPKDIPSRTVPKDIPSRTVPKDIPSRGVPKDIPSRTVPKDIPSRGVPLPEAVKKLQQQGKTPPRKFPPRTIGPPAVLNQQTTTPSEVHYPFSSGTLLTLAQPAQTDELFIK